ncbi:MAG TPA: YggT family protein [Thermoanaerobaculia bacterium]|nr:YggT family protein [Thermoanaerobaculia bacterium]HXK66906.1 YggT family protein [Thermoanaerobaculia bacterium]
MPVGKAFIMALLTVVLNLVWLYKWIIIIRALISWVNPDPYNPIVRILYVLTEPVLRPFRRLMPPYKTGGLDFSPLFVFAILYFIEVFAHSLIAQVAWK